MVYIAGDEHSVDMDERLGNYADGVWVGPGSALQECRDCGQAFPLDADADRCARCAAAMLEGGDDDGEAR